MTHAEYGANREVQSTKSLEIHRPFHLSLHGRQIEVSLARCCLRWNRLMLYWEVEVYFVRRSRLAQHLLLSGVVEVQRVSLV